MQVFLEDTGCCRCKRLQSYVRLTKTGHAYFERRHIYKLCVILLLGLRCGNVKHNYLIRVCLHRSEDRKLQSSYRARYGKRRDK